MYIKRYTVAAVIWMALVGWYVYAYITHDTMGFDFFGIPLPSLSIALWVVVPVFILYLGSVFHMGFYSFLGSLRLRKYDQDYERMIDAIVDAFLGKKERAYNFKTPRYKLLGSLLKQTTLSATDDLIDFTNNDKIDKIIRTIEKIKRGEVVDLKQYGLLPTNPLVIENEKNKYKMGALDATTILSHASKYDKEFCEDVYAEFVKTASLNDIQRYKECLTKEALYNIIARINTDTKDKLDISNEALIDLIESLEFTKDEYIELSKVLAKSGILPEQRMKLFEVLGDKHEGAMEAYLYTLFDLEMLAPAKEILQNSHDDEFERFKAYYALKECGKNFSIELFV